MHLVELIKLFFRKKVFARFAYTIAFGPDGPRADKLSYITPHRGISYNGRIS